MKLNSNDLISKGTQTSARGLLAVSSAAILIERHSLDPNDWRILSGSVTAEVFFEATATLILFLAISLFVHWYSDFILYKTWFKTNEVNQGTLWGNSAPKDTEPVISGLSRRLTTLAKKSSELDRIAKSHPKYDDAYDWNNASSSGAMIQFEKVSDWVEDADKRFKSLQSELKILNEMLDELEPRFQKVDFVARFVVFFWYLGLPMLIAALGLYSMSI